jgi:hypothetical protein
VRGWVKVELAGSTINTYSASRCSTPGATSEHKETTMFHARTLLPASMLLGMLCAVSAPAAQDEEAADTLQSEPESVSPDADVSAAPPAKKSAAGIEYRSGGVGKGERDALLLVTKRYSLKIVLAAKGDRAFVYDAKIRMLDASGKPVVEADDAGPLFFANLPAGKYKVVATAYGQTKEQTVTVSAGKQTAISFTW